MNDTQRNKRLEKARIRVLFQVQFFAPGVAKLPVEWDDTVETACTDGQVIRWQREFFDGLKDQEVCTVLCHEVAHCLLGHLWRAPVGCEWDSWNEATDHGVNLMLEEFASQVTAQRLANPFPFPEGTWCKDSKYSGMSEESIYAAIQRSKAGSGGNSGQPDNQSSGSAAGGGKAGQSKGGSKPGQGAQSGKTQGTGKGQPAPGGGAGSDRQKFGEMMAPKGGEQAARQSKTDWEATLHQSVIAAKSRGELPGSMARYVKGITESKVPWHQLLAAWLREQVQEDWDWHRPDLRFDDTGFIMPSLHSERMAPVVFGIDTSGSIDDTLLAKFKSEMQSCLDELRPVKLVELCADTRITSEREYQCGDTIHGDAPGGGGTSFVPVMKRCAKMQPVPRCLVYLTDGEGTYGDEPGFPVMWVMYGGRNKVPYGEIVEVK